MQQAKRFKKEVICLSTDGSTTPKDLEEFSGLERDRYKSLDKDSLINYVDTHFHHYNVTNYVFKDKEPENMTFDEKKLLFEQYKEMFASTESLMSRRQGTSSFYISINTVLVAMMAAVFALGLDLKMLCMFGFVISLFGIVMSKTWSQTLDSYDRINYSKFNVLESMERYLPAAMFYAEYKDTKNGLIKRTVPSYSIREHIIPKLFMILYSIVSISLIMTLIYLLLSSF